MPAKRPDGLKLVIDDFTIFLSDDDVDDVIDDDDDDDDNSLAGIDCLEIVSNSSRIDEDIHVAIKLIEAILHLLGKNQSENG